MAITFTAWQQEAQVVKTGTAVKNVSLVVFYKHLSLQRPLSELVAAEQSVQSRQTTLLLWFYEDQLKAKYALFLSTIKVRFIYIHH